MPTHLERDRIVKRIEKLQRRLDARSDVEKAFFDGSWLSVPMLMLVAFIWGWELVANFRGGEGWASVAHWAVIVPLEGIALIALALGMRSLIWRARIVFLRRKLRPLGAESRAARVSEARPTQSSRAAGTLT